MDTTSPPPGTPAPDPHTGFPRDPFPAFVVTTSTDGVGVGVSDLTVDDLPPGDVLIEVAWSAVNYKDGMVTRPGNRVARTSPLVPGVDLVGTVVASQDADIVPGELVIAHGYDIGVARHGGFAQFARVPSGWVLPLPDGLTLRRAATLGTAGFTAALSIHRLERHGLRPGTGPVLVTGASGGVGSMAVALSAARGYEVVASTGRIAERDYLVSLGAADVVDRDALVVDPQRTLGPERWSGAIDCVGGTTLAAVLRTLRYGAAVAASGLTGGATFESSVYPFIVRNAALLGIDTVLTPIEERRAVWSDLANWVSGSLVDTLVAGEVNLSGLAPALADILDGQIRGRMLVRPEA